MIRKRVVALVTPYVISHRTAEETLALGYLAAVLREGGYRVIVVDGWLRGIGPEEMVEYVASISSPDVVCMSCYRSNLEQARHLLRCFEEKFGKIPSICGGYGPTFHDTDFLEAGFLVAVRGEAEHLITSIIKSLINKEDPCGIKGISYKKEGRIVRTEAERPIINLDFIPFPERDEINYLSRRKNPAHVSTSRGCRAHCSFCSVAAFTAIGTKKEKWRGRSIKNIVDELRFLYEQFGITHVKFVDDSFIEPPRNECWADQFASAIAHYNIPLRFRTQVRADRLTLPMVKSLKKCGWFSTSIGIENAAATALGRMCKSATVQNNLNSLKWLHNNDVYVQMGMILFDPFTTMAELEENYYFLKDHDWVITKGIFTEMFAAKGTLFAKQLKRNNLVNAESLYESYRYEIHDPVTRRAYCMLKKWHRSHAQVYDWVIDSLSAPKVLPDIGYKEVHFLCRELLKKDIYFLKLTIDHVCKDSIGQEDDALVLDVIKENSMFYSGIEKVIRAIYFRFGLTYDGTLNPFLE